MKNFVSLRARRLLAVLLVAASLLGGAFWGLRAALPDTFYVDDTETENNLHIASMPYITAVRQGGGGTAQAGSVQVGGSRNRTLCLWGVLPIKTVRVVASQRRQVTVSGAPFGIKMFSDGALVVAFSDLYTALGSENPAKEAGLRLGDLITDADGYAVRGNEDLTAAIQAAGGQPICVEYRREGRAHSCLLTPARDRDSGQWRAGVWVRDSSAGIGTLTFTDPERGSFAGLGHAISDADTGAEIELLSGEIVPVTITGYVRGAAGAPGELRGDFGTAVTEGIVLANDTTGVYGILTSETGGSVYPVANMQEVALGPAQLLTTIDGRTPRLYTVEIERVNMTAGDPNRNLLLHVTDPELLQSTGGIVQGMSGSPLLQGGRLIGAVTHVLVNDPTRGYGIFAQTMLSHADAIAAAPQPAVN